MIQQTPEPPLDNAIDAAVAALQQARAKLLDDQPPTTLVAGTPLQKAVRFRRQRDERAKLFGEDLFGEPAWDMLLDLFIARECKGRLLIKAVASTDHIPPTTGLRWIAVLEERGLIRRERDEDDGRRSWLSLTEDTYVRLKQWLERF